MKQKHPAFWLALPTISVLLVLFVAPMLYVLANTLATDGLRHFIKFFTDSFYLDILKTTLAVSLKVTVICLLLGYPTAYFMARTKSRMKNTLMIIILFPFLVSAVVRSYGWMVILGNKGLLNQFLLALGIIDDPLKILYTANAVIIGLVHLLLPYMILSITGVIQGIDKNIEYAAYSLGANPLGTFWKVILPLSSPGIISGMMSTMVFQEVNVNFNWGLASAISYILMFVILAVLLLFNYSTSGITKRVGGGKNV